MTKNKKTKKLKTNYSTEQKIKQLMSLRNKLRNFGLDVYNTEMKKLGNIMNEYIKNDIEFDGSIPLPGSKRVMDIIFKNNSKYVISINLRYISIN